MEELTYRLLLTLDASFLFELEVHLNWKAVKTVLRAYIKVTCGRRQWRICALFGGKGV
jgi:hypothetical protein